ncbi:MAG: STAS domain-containing protein [Planctomycetota bacterium]
MDASASWTARPLGRIVAGRRRGSGGYGELRADCEQAILGGVRRLEIDLTHVDAIGSDLLRCLTAVLRAAHRHRVQLKIQPSLALDRWLTVCGLDHSLEPVRRAV